MRLYKGDKVIQYKYANDERGRVLRDECKGGVGYLLKDALNRFVWVHYTNLYHDAPKEHLVPVRCLKFIERPDVWVRGDGWLKKLWRIYIKKQRRPTNV